MANVLVGNLPTYTGNTTGVYIVMNDSGNTTTYKVLNSYLGVPAWTSGGTIQSVGWSGTTTAPTVGTTSRNNISYRQLGNKQWEVVMSFQTSGTGGSTGNGDYLFTLPNGLNFDTTKPWQTIFTNSVGSSDIVFAQNTIPSGSGMISDNSTSTSSDFQPVVWDATRFRLMVHLPGVKIQCMGSGFWQLTASYGFNITFQFTSL